MNYRKKQIVIEAVQFVATKESFDEILSMGLRNWSPGAMGSESFSIQTTEGEMMVRKNDFVIKGVNGEFYPCKPDIFIKTYEKV